jgi:hypothetical protein
MTAMILPHSVMVPDNGDHHGMPPLSPILIAADPALDSPMRLDFEAELIGTYAPVYGLPFARRLLERARELRAADLHHERTHP